MTAHRDLKNLIRARQAKTGESYTAARLHIMRERAARLGLTDEADAVEVGPVDAAVLKVNRSSARLRILGEDGAVTVRAASATEVVPGQIVTVHIDRRWTWRGDAYASGRIDNPRIDIARLGLVPLPLRDDGMHDLAGTTEPYRRPDPYAPMWRKLTATPRPSFDFDPIAWGALPGRDIEDNPTCDAAERMERDPDGARDLLMDVLATDLRVLDAHAHLGNLEFERWPARAQLHYEIGVRIGELSLPAGFDSLLVWGRIYNRPFLRCLYGYGLCRWRAGDLAEANAVFERILRLNPTDNQGVRFCWNDIGQGHSWEEAQQRECNRAAHIA